MNIKGIIAASMSLFNKDLTLDVDSTIQHALKIIKEGCHGVVLFGSTGQAQLISTIEKRKLITKLSDNEMKNHFIIGAGNNSLKENIGLMKHSIDNGINRFLLMPPAYYKYGDEGAFSFYENIVNEVPESKIILYNLLCRKQVFLCQYYQSDLPRWTRLGSPWDGSPWDC